MKKIIALLLSVVLLCGMVLTAPMVLAEDAATGETTPVVSDAKQINFVDNAVKCYPESTFTQFGENLWSDPTVGDFAADGTYNTEGWWAKKTLEGQEAFMWNSPVERGHISNDPTVSHTADGSGAIVVGNNIDNYTYRLPALEANSKYVVTYWLYKPTASTDGVTYLHFGYNGPEYCNQAIPYYSAGWTQQILLIQTNDKCFYNSSTSAYENFGGNVFLKFYPSGDPTGIRWDDFACYKVSEEMEATFDEAWTNNAFTLDATLTATKEVKISDIGNYTNVLASKTPNLFPDPNVSLFDEDGRYLQYYDETLSTNADKTTVINSNAWWDMPSDLWQYVGEYANGNTGRALYCGMDINGQVINDPTLSRTNDGSGVIQLIKPQGQYIKLPEMDAYSYYVVTFYVKGVTSTDTWFSHGVVYSGTGETAATGDYYSVNDSNWFEFTYVIYTGSTACNPYIYTWGGGYYLDDFSCFKLTNAEGAAAIENGALTISDEDKTIAVTDTYGGDTGGNKAPIDTAKLGNNLILDGTVANFDSEGNYSSYLTDQGVAISNTTVADETAWWDKYVNEGQYNEWVGGGSATVYQGMKKNNKLSNDIFESHTLDGSGAIKHEGSSRLYFPLAKMESYSYYYVSFWVYNAHWAQVEICSDLNTNIATIINSNAGQNAWRRVSALIYTGDTTMSQPYITIHCGSDATETEPASVVYFDDFEQYKVDFGYADQVIAAGDLVDNGVEVEVDVPGDIDNDGSWTAQDLALMKMIVLGIGTNDKAIIVAEEGKTKANLVDLVLLKQLCVLVGVE